MVFRGKKKRYSEIISNSDFFDADWYNETYPDVRASKMDPALHYYLYGAREQRDPSGKFSTSLYIKDNPSLIGTGENPIVHFERNKNVSAADPQDDFPGVDGSKDKIPKILHHVWLSDDPVPAPLSLNARTFLKLHPDFEVKKWNIASLEGDETPFFRDALREKKWAFATDYIRLKALYEDGGVYADGDVALYRPLDRYRQFESVFCWENYFAIGPHFMMAAPRNEVVGRILDIYRSRKFYENDQLNLTPIPVIVTWILTTEYGLRLDGSRQILDGVNLVETENVFTTNFNDGRCVAEHMYYGGWVPEHSTSYKDGLIDTANRWMRENTAEKIERQRKATNPLSEWSYYFLRNAETAFPAMGEIDGLEDFKRLKELALSGGSIGQKQVIEAVKNANPLYSISKWHLKPKAPPTLPSKKADELTEFLPQITRIIKRNSHKVSVVVPIYNVEKYLVKCLKSIQSQDYREMEIILVDDGSTDNSGKIAQAMTEADTRFKLLRKENGGLGDARNFAIEHLKSDLVTFVDSDDFLTDNHISLLEAEFCQGHDLAICDFKVTTPDGRLIETRELSKFWGEPDAISQALVSNYECYAWNKMYPTESFTDNDMARYSLGWFEDLALTPALIGSAKSIGFVGAATYNYVQRPDSILSTARKKVERNIEVFTALQMLERHKDRVPSKYWDLYANWMAPKHYFYWRVAALLREKSHGARVAYCDLFASKLNEQVPGWNKTEYITHFVKEAATPHQAMRRKNLIDAFTSNDLAFYGLVTDPSEYGL